MTYKKVRQERIEHEAREQEHILPTTKPPYWNAGRTPNDSSGFAMIGIICEDLHRRCTWTTSGG